MSVDFGDKVRAKKGVWFQADGAHDVDVYVDTGDILEIVNIEKHYLGENMYLLHNTKLGYFIKVQETFFNLYFEVV